MSQAGAQLPNLRKPLSRTLPPPPTQVSGASSVTTDGASALSDPNHPDYVEDAKLGVRCGALKRRIGRTLENLDRLLAQIDELKSSPDAAEEVGRIGMSFSTPSRSTARSPARF